MSWNLNYLFLQFYKHFRKIKLTKMEQILQAVPQTAEILQTPSPNNRRQHRRLRWNVGIRKPGGTREILQQTHAVKLQDKTLPRIRKPHSTRITHHGHMEQHPISHRTQTTVEPSFQAIHRQDFSARRQHCKLDTTAKRTEKMKRKGWASYGPFFVISLITPAATVVPISLTANLPNSGKSV